MTAGGLCWPPGASYEQTWKRSLRGWYTPNINALCLQFWPQGYHMNKLGRDPQGHATHKISNLYSFQFHWRKKLKFSFSVPVFQIVTPGAKPVLAPGTSYEQIWWMFTRRYYITKHQSSKPSNFREKEFWRILKFPSLFLCSNLWPPRWGQFWLKGHHMNKLGWDLLGDAKY